MSGDGVRGCARSVSRLDGVVPDRWSEPGYELPLHGRLRGPGLLFCRNRYPPGCPQSQVQG